MLSPLILNLSTPAAAGWSPEAVDIDYTPSDTADSNGYQVYNLYLPPQGIHTQPAAGWPVVAYINNTSYTASAKAPTISGVRLLLVNAGIAVADCTVTITDTGDANIIGGGMFWDPDDAAWDTEDVPEQDVSWIIQNLRYRAASFGLDPLNVGVMGEGYAAAQLAAWIGMEADMADPAGAHDQLKESTVPDAVVAVSALWWNPAMLAGTNQDHLRDSAVTSTKATTYGDATTAHRLRSSPLYRNFLNSAGGVGVPFYVRATTATTPTTTAVDSDGLPTFSNTTSNETNGWQSLQAMASLREHVGDNVFHGQKSVITSRFTAQFHIADKFVTTAQEESDMAAFMKSVLAGWGGVDTWNLVTDWRIPSESRRRGVAVKGGAYHTEQFAQSVSKTRREPVVRSWETGGSNVPATDITRLRAIWTAARGAVRKFDYPDPTGPGSVPARFVGGSLVVTEVAFDRFNYRVKIEEAV